MTELARCAGAFEANLELFRLAPQDEPAIRGARNSVVLLLAAMAKAVPAEHRERFAYESAQARDSYLTDVAAASDATVLAARLAAVRDAGAKCLAEVLPQSAPEAAGGRAATSAAPTVATVGLRR